MKKCPKCGTILDDSKKTCYMCGSSLQESDNLSTNRKTNSVLSKAQKNVFKEQDSIKINAKDIVKNNNKGTYFNNNSSTTSFFNEEINKLNQMEYDERGALQKNVKSFFGNQDNESFKSKEQLNKEKQSFIDKVKEKKQKKKEEKELLKKEAEKQKELEKNPYADYPTPVNQEIISEYNNQQNNEGMLADAKQTRFFASVSQDNKKESNVIYDKKEEKMAKENIRTDFFDQGIEEKNLFTKGLFADDDFSNQKTSYDSNNDTNKEIKNNAHNFFKRKDLEKNNGKQDKINYEIRQQTIHNEKASKTIEVSKGIKGSTIFNTCCVVIFGILAIGVIINICFNKKNNLEKLGELKFKIGEDFKYNKSLSNDKYKEYIFEKDEGCAIKITYTESDKDDVDAKINEFQNSFSGNEEVSFQKSKLNNNGNVWKYLKIFSKNSKISNASVINEYALIYKNKKTYEIIYFNLNANELCLKKYNSFINTLNF